MDPLATVICHSFTVCIWLSSFIQAQLEHFSVPTLSADGWDTLFVQNSSEALVSPPARQQLWHPTNVGQPRHFATSQGMEGFRLGV
jgi:hypothetical protein